MSKKLSILIPHYHEPIEIIGRLLDSIKLQRMIDFNAIEVIIGNDGSDIILEDADLEKYNFDIDYIVLPKMGVSAVRNILLKEAKGEYIMYCDADDMFLDMLSLQIIFAGMKKDFDLLISNLFVEVPSPDDSGKIVLTTRNNDMTVIHGKVYKRQYLLENNILWNETLTYNEDNYFNGLAHALTKKIIKIDKPFYIQLFNENSVTHQEYRSHIVKYDTILTSTEALVTELLNRKLLNAAQFQITSTIYLSYFTMNIPDWFKFRQQKENKDLIHKNEKLLQNFLKKYLRYFDETAKDLKEKIYKAHETSFVKRGIDLKRVMPYELWFKYITNLK